MEHTLKLVRRDLGKMFCKYVHYNRDYFLEKGYYSYPNWNTASSWEHFRHFIAHYLYCMLTQPTRATINKSLVLLKYSNNWCLVLRHNILVSKICIYSSFHNSSHSPNAEKGKELWYRLSLLTSFFQVFFLVSLHVPNMYKIYKKCWWLMNTNF